MLDKPYSPNSTGLYTANEVEGRTAVPATTLRQWERRYGLPRPQRGANGYRLYSEVDLQQIHFIKARIQDGISVSRAVELCLNLETTLLIHSSEENAQAKQPRVLLDYVELLIASTLQSDYEEANYWLEECYQLYSVDDVLTHIIEPALVGFGARWQRGEISIADEHQASTYLRGKLQILLDRVGQPKTGLSVVVACGPEEHHEIGALMLSVMLKRSGVGVYYLGANTPLADLMHYTQNRKSQALLISVGSEKSMNALKAQSFELSSLKIPIFYGGAWFNQHPEMAFELGGQYLGGNTQQAIRHLIHILQKGV